MQGSNYHILPSKCIFSEKFQDLASVMKNGATFYGTIVFKNNIGSIGTGVSLISYPKIKGYGTCSVRLIARKYSTTRGYLIDLRVGFASYYIYDTNLTTLTTNAPNLYVNGKLSSTIYNGSMIFTEFVLTGIIATKNAAGFNIGASNGQSSTSIMDIKLLEIYNYSLSAAEVADLYNQTLYNDPTR